MLLIFAKVVGYTMYFMSVFFAPARSQRSKISELRKLNLSVARTSASQDDLKLSFSAIASENFSEIVCNKPIALLIATDFVTSAPTAENEASGVDFKVLLATLSAV